MPPCCVAILSVAFVINLNRAAQVNISLTTPVFVGSSLVISCTLTAVASPGSVSISRPAGPAARCVVDEAAFDNGSAEDGGVIVYTGNATDAGEGSEPSQNHWWEVKSAIVDANATSLSAGTSLSYYEGCTNLVALRRKQTAVVVFTAVGGATDEMGGPYTCQVAASAAGLRILAQSTESIVAVKSNPDEPLLLPEPLTFNLYESANVSCQRPVSRLGESVYLTYECAEAEGCPSADLVTRAQPGTAVPKWFAFTATVQWHGVVVKCQITQENAVPLLTLSHISINYLLVQPPSSELSQCEQPAAAFRLCDPETITILSCSPFVRSQPVPKFMWNRRFANGTAWQLTNWTADGQVALPVGTGLAGAVHTYECVAHNPATSARVSISVDILWKDYYGGIDIALPSLFETLDPAKVGSILGATGCLLVAAGGITFYTRKRKMCCFHDSLDGVPRSKHMIHLEEKDAAAARPTAGIVAPKAELAV